MANDHPVQWVTASPLWDAFTQDAARMQRPALLRFASDTFMDDLAALLKTNPGGLADQLARPESFRARPPGARVDWQPLAPGATLKLYQPVHGHFYLIAASLVCRMAGLPDRTVNTANAEKVSFVLRRIGPDGEEMAWVTAPAGSKGWQSLTKAQQTTVSAGEELLPMFPVNFTPPAATRFLTVPPRGRRLLVGLVPTSSRDAFAAGPRLTPILPEDNASLGEVQGRVVDPLRALIQSKSKPLPTDVKPADQAAIAQAEESKEEEGSRFLLLDLADFLSRTLPSLWQAVYAAAPPAVTDPGAGLYNLLLTARAAGAITWQQALRTAWDERDVINGEKDGTSSLTFSLKDTKLDPDALAAALQTALGPPPANPPPPANAPPVPKLDPRPETQYVLRCVYQRPRCGPLRPDVVSNPTERFALAPYFDFDAPSRPFRIALPVDTSIAGLRKFAKNVGFLMSNQLRQQIKSVTDLKKTLDGNLASGEQFSLGEICSFSIPVITLCALVVLMIFIALLNIVFWWLPFIRLCLPIPLKKG
jgi:hypothetical protein